MDLTCYLHPGWQPHVRPAPATRDWMDGTPEAFAYRCLPLSIANAHGWEILSRSGFEAHWRGGPGTEDVVIRPLQEVEPHLHPVSIFGHGMLTFHIFGIFRTPPGWNLWVSGSPNRFKDGLAPLSGVIETDWSPYSFTMNWRFTRPNHVIRFEVGEPYCFFFPVQRDLLETVEPRFRPFADNPELAEQYLAWKQSRDSFRAYVDETQPAEPTKRWQKRYYRGLDMKDETAAPGHRVKLRLRPFGEPER